MLVLLFVVEEGLDRRAGFRFSNFQNMFPEITCLILARKFKVKFFKLCCVVAIDMTDGV